MWRNKDIDKAAIRPIMTYTVEKRPKPLKHKDAGDNRN